MANVSSGKIEHIIHLYGVKIKKYHSKSNKSLFLTKSKTLVTVQKDDKTFRAWRPSQVLISISLSNVSKLMNTFELCDTL